MANKTYRVGIVGLSGITAGRPEESPPPFRDQITNSHASSLVQVPGVEIVGVCDLLPEMQDRFKKTWSDHWPKANAYSSHKEMLDKEDIDILTVATSDHRHADITVDGANAGVKGVFCEKPLATSIEDADRMIKACEDNGAVLIVDHTWRWDPLFHKARETIRAGGVGRLSTIFCTHAGRRAMLFRNGTHKIDGICYFAESEPVKVFAQLEDGFEGWDRYRGDGGKLSENDPAASGYILFRNGVRAYYCGAKDTFQNSAYQVSGPDGQITVTPWGGHEDRTAELLTSDPNTGEVVRKTLVPDQYVVRNLTAAYRELIGMIENGGDGVSSGREARKTVQIMVGFLKSQQEGSRLVDVPA